MTRPESQDYHLARLLLLVNAFAQGEERLDGLTKLAKLDFLLRYPTFLERLLDTRGLRWPTGTPPEPAERLAVESRMIRYKYGPWDDRYYEFVGALIGRGLVENAPGQSLSLRPTDLGRQVADAIAQDDAWNIVARRAALLKARFNTSGSALKTMIYRELPDVVDRPHRVEISPPGVPDTHGPT